MGDWAAVVGTLGGAAVGAGGAYWLQRSDRRHRDRRRWDETRRSAAVEVITTFDASYGKLLDWGRAARNFGPDSDQTAHAAMLADEQIGQFLRAIAAAEFVGSPELADIMSAMSDQINKDMRVAMAGKVAGDPEWDAALEEIRPVRRAFVELARKELE